MTTGNFTKKERNRKRTCGSYKIQFAFFLLFLFVFLNFTLRAASPNQIRIQKAQLKTEFQQTLDSLVSCFGIPGATAAFVLPDGTTKVAATGFSDLESKTKMTKQSRMLAASIGKTFVAATVTSLAFEGAINLDEPVSKWLGNRQWFSRLPNYNQITVRHLLTHTAGLPDHVYQEEFAREVSLNWREKDNLFTPEELIGFILDLPPLFEAGKDFAYSDTGYILLGLLIEQVTEKKVFDVITEKFLMPFNLDLTTPSDNRLLKNLSAGYTAKDNPFGFPEKTTSGGVMCWHPGLEWTGGGFVSNSENLARWGWILLSGKAMPHSYLEELLKAVSTSKESNKNQYGAGVAIYRNSPLGDIYGHSGWIPGYCSSMRYYPDYGIAVAFQINTDIEIVGSQSRALHEIESCLAKVAIKQLNR
jgi:D-alanyl-D-alanine carboxypeptidase